MKFSVPPELEKGRITKGRMATTSDMSWNGVFEIKIRGRWYTLIISDDGGWEHVSVEVTEANRCPTWGEMCIIKDLCWLPNETVIQYHPAQENYVSLHPWVLHLWRPTAQAIPLPPKIFV